MTPTIHLLRLENWPIYQQLQLEEALLRTDDRNWCILNEKSSDAIIMGISGKPNELINHEIYGENPIPLIRRFSGGGCVLVDENTLFISLIINQKAVDVHPFPKSIMAWTQVLYSPFFHDLPFKVRENDYVIGDHKFGGNAQYIIKDRWLHHTTMLWDYCPDKMSILAIPPTMPDYREKRSHSDFLCHLKPHFNDTGHFFSKFQHSLGNLFSVIPTDCAEATLSLKKPHRKATTFVTV